MHQISREPVSEDLIALLEVCALPVGDVALGGPTQFFGIRTEGALVAVVGLECYGHIALLRSLAVAPSVRGLGLAKSLVSFAESYASSNGIGELFLLTTTAEQFFLRRGYVPTSRIAAPTVIQATSEFTELCPASSVLLSKHMAPGG